MPPEVRNRADFPRLKILYENHLWPAGADRDQPHEETIRKVARNAVAGELICLDVERWKLQDPGTPLFEEELAKLESIERWMREENPSVRLGFYGLVSWSNQNHRAKDKLWRQRQSRARNDALAALFGKMDALFPPLYTNFDYKGEEWYLEYLEAVVSEARRCAPHLPVIPLVWFRYHQSAKDRAFGMLEVERWGEQLDLVERVADGAIVWGGYRQPWDRQAAWWLELEPRLAPPAQRASYD